MASVCLTPLKTWQATRTRRKIVHCMDMLMFKKNFFNPIKYEAFHKC